MTNQKLLVESQTESNQVSAMNYHSVMLLQGGERSLSKPLDEFDAGILKLNGIPSWYECFVSSLPFLVL